MKANSATKPTQAGPAEIGRALLWVGSSTIAAAIGVTVARPAGQLVREPLAQLGDGILTIALFGAIFGACLGAVQASTRLGREGHRPLWWMLLTMVSGAVAWVVGVKLATVVTDSTRGQILVYISEVLGYLALGAVVGLLFGLVQGPLRRVSGQGMLPWIGLSMLGWALGFVVAAGVGLLISDVESITLRDLIFGAVTGLVAGGTQALFAARGTGV